ncbi:MAG TPA: DJ-1/PfpI family protein [Thermoleophilaceae bacterium]|nr:DJ-1/PfpI family protein [Thermoleophilaceae bacterium]
MDIVIPLYDRFTALDAVGPYEVLSRLPGARVTFAAVEPRPYTTDTGMLTLNVDAALADFPGPEVLVVPGGPGSTAATDDEALIDWIRTAHETSEWTTSVCTGSELLGAAGLLEGLEATTYWADMEMLERYGARPTESRVVEQGKIVTAAGVSSGIDMALTLVARITNDEVAKAIQLGIEYDPQPPFDSGSTRTASKETVELVRAAIAARDEATA